MDTLFIVIPAYNESENIEKCVNDWYPVIEKIAKEDSNKSRLIIINDGSKDDTFEKLKVLAENRPYLTALTKTNSGHGATVMVGYNYAINNGSDYIFQTDSDGQTNPVEFEQFWNLRMKYDAIIGNRIMREDGKDRKFVENTVCFLLNMIFGVKVSDANAPFRLMKTELIQKYIHKLPKDFNIPNIMFTTYFVYNHEKVQFLPITFKSRQAGTNSVNFKKISQIGWKAVGDFRRLKKEIDNV